MIALRSRKRTFVGRGIREAGGRILLLLGLPATCACGAKYLPVELTADGAEVVVSSDPPPAGCEEIGRVSASHGTQCNALDRTGTQEGAYRVLRNSAGARGANYVQIEREIQPNPRQDNCLYAVRGRAFFCELPP
jgi:hypothetical protein